MTEIIPENIPFFHTCRESGRWNVSCTDGKWHPVFPGNTLWGLLIIALSWRQEGQVNRITYPVLVPGTSCFKASFVMVSFFFSFFHTRLNCNPIWFFDHILPTKRFSHGEGTDRVFMVIPMGAAMVPKSLVIILVLVAWVYSMMGGKPACSQERYYSSTNSGVCHPKKLSDEVWSCGQYWMHDHWSSLLWQRLCMVFWQSLRYPQHRKRIMHKPEKER